MTITTACGGAAPPPPAPAAPAPKPADPNRRLDHDECVSLGQRMADACQTRPNERSARVDGWCSEILSGVSSGAWVTSECLAHIRYMDAACIHSATNVHAMMDCDSGVDRSTAVH